jgi:hypothetical protein
MKNNISDYSNKIKKANRFYNALTKLDVFKKGDFAEKINVLETIAYFNWHVHSGRYDSSFINNQIDELTKEFSTKSKGIEPEFEYTNHVVFIGTEMYDAGGHTRLLENIAKYEKENGRDIILIITDQAAPLMPLRIINEKGMLFKDVIGLAGKSSIEKIEVIRGYMKNAYRVYNSQHPDDVEPTIALNYLGRPMTIYINHADHVFWVGAKYCDCILNIRPFAKQISEGRRNAQIPSVVLPIKLELNKQYPSKDFARQVLQVGDDKIVLLTISSFYKVIPDNHYNIFNTIKKILALNDLVEYYFVGITVENFVDIMQEKPPERLHCLGVIEDPILYQCAADFYLEGMPMNSLTALLESIYAGAYPVLMWGPYFVNMNIEDEIYIDRLVKHTKDETAYMENLKLLIAEKDQPYIQEVINHIKRKTEWYCSTAYWDKILDDIKPVFDESNNYKEFDCSISDIHVYQSWETYWQFQQTNVYEIVFKKIAKQLSFFKVNKLFYTYVFFDPLVKNINKLKIYRRVLKKRLTN